MSGESRGLDPAIRFRKALSITRKEKKPFPHLLAHPLDPVASFQIQASVHHFIVIDSFQQSSKNPLNIHKNHITVKVFYGGSPLALQTIRHVRPPVWLVPPCIFSLSPRFFPSLDFELQLIIKRLQISFNKLKY